jgi:hypothetical protein
LAVGVFWPSKKFAEADLIPGGAASADTDQTANRVLLDRLDGMKHIFGSSASDETIEQMKGLIAGLSTNAADQNRFVSLLGNLMDEHIDRMQLSDDEGTATISDRLKTTTGAALLNTFSAPVVQKPKLGGGGAAAGIGGNPVVSPGAGPAAGIGDFFAGMKAGALRMLNLVTYYVMKDRAGKIGQIGLNPSLLRIQTAVPFTLRFCLVGHSFGGRLVTATVDGPNALSVQSLLLLQAAYSHNGLALNFDGTKSGFFHTVFDQHKVKGPILITHSKNDRAVGLAYPLASRLNGDDAAGIGGPDDRFGGMGANGAQHIDKVDTDLLLASGKYDFVTSGKRVFNLNGDKIIQSHGDVARDETAAVLAAAMSL